MSCAIQYSFLHSYHKSRADDRIQVPNPCPSTTESYFDLLSCCDFKLWQRIRNESVDDATKGEKVTTNGSYHDDLFLNVERLIDCSCDVGTLF